VVPINEEKPLVPQEEGEMTVELPCCTVQKKHIGYAAAIFNGCWGGSILVPLKLSPKSGIEFVFSFAMGSALVNITILIIYSIIRYIVYDKPPPSPQFRVMLIPGAIAGILWSTGNFLSIYAVILISESIAYPSVQAALLVGGLWGIFYYKELNGAQATVWFISAAVTLGGIVLLSQEEVIK